MNRFACPRLDLRIHIHERASQPPRNLLPDGGLARAHKAGYDDVVMFFIHRLIVGVKVFLNDLLDVF